LFAQGDLDAFLQHRLERLAATLKPARRHQPDDIVQARIAKLETRHLLQPPKILSGARVVEQGQLADGNSPDAFPAGAPADPARFATRRAYLEARIAYLEAYLKHVSPRTYALVEVPFEGDPLLFEYRPGHCRIEAPAGEIRGTTIRFRLERSGPQDPEWRGELKTDLLALEAILLHTRRQVALFNRTAAQAIRAAQQPPPPSTSRRRRPCRQRP
jgi:hypothetical protein